MQSEKAIALLARKMEIFKQQSWVFEFFSMSSPLTPISTVHKVWLEMANVNFTTLAISYTETDHSMYSADGSEMSAITWMLFEMTHLLTETHVRNQSAICTFLRDRHMYYDTYPTLLKKREEKLRIRKTFKQALEDSLEAPGNGEHG